MSTVLTGNIQAAASIISLLNDYLLSTGRPPLGFLNPWLYGRGFAGLNDIIYGSNPGCGTVGFPATPGWDPVRPTRLVFLSCQLTLIPQATGLGSLDFVELRKILDYGY